MLKVRVLMHELVAELRDPIRLPDHVVTRGSTGTVQARLSGSRQLEPAPVVSAAVQDL